MPAFATANSGTITYLVQGRYICCSRSLADSDAARLDPAERASSGVGCSRNSRNRSSASSSASPGGLYAYVSMPMMSPMTIGSIPEESSASQMATPATKYAGPDRTRKRRSVSGTRKSASATSSGPSCTSPLYTVAITTSATTSSTTSAVRRNARTCSGTRRPSRARAPSANAVSVDIATPQAWAAGRPALTARKIRAGTAMPASPAASGSARRDRSRRSPRSNSRRASSPTTKKKNVMSPLLTQPRRSRATDQSSSRISSSLVQKEWYDEVATLAQISASSAPARRNAALPDSVLRKRCRGVAMLFAHAVVPVNDRADPGPPSVPPSAPPSGPSTLTRMTLAYRGPPRQSQGGRRSEGGFVELHQRRVGGLGDRALGGELRQDLPGEEPGRRDLALVEGLVPSARTLRQFGERDLGLTQQQPRDDQVTRRQQQPGRVLADLVEVARVAALDAGVGIHRGMDQRPVQPLLVV